MSEPVVADLHIHTTVSDGILEITEIPELAKTQGLSAVGITDHDRIHPWFDDPVAEESGVLLIRGIELRVEREDGTRFDILGYAIEETEALTDLLEQIQEARIERGKEMIALLEDRLDIVLDVSVGPGFGRPHMARAVAEHPETDYTELDVFRELIGNGKPCYVSRWVPAIDHGIEILEEAAAVLSVAHPLRYDDVDGAISLAKRVGGIERWYPYEQEVSLDPIDVAIEEEDLIPTGGSDAHDTEIGTTGVPAEAFAHLIDSGNIERASVRSRR